MLSKAEFQTLSDAVVIWYRHYGVSPVALNSAVLCRAAVDLLRSGLTNADDIAASLIATYSADDLPVRVQTAGTRH